MNWGYQNSFYLKIIVSIKPVKFTCFYSISTINNQEKCVNFINFLRAIFWNQTVLIPQIDKRGVKTSPCLKLLVSENIPFSTITVLILMMPAFFREKMNIFW